jgi:predicted negative regulator of RcsB-dependent stress response
VAGRAKEALALLSSARAASDAGQFDQALAQYSQIVREFGDLALSEYARVGRALTLYQVR